MKRFGADEKRMRAMNEADVFKARLHLMIVVVKAALKGYPVGEFRKNAALENANEVYTQTDKIDLSFLKNKTSSHLFRERIKLLCIMCSAIVSNEYPLGVYRRQAVLDNIDMIVEFAFPQQDMGSIHKTLKVA